MQIKTIFFNSKRKFCEIGKLLLQLKTKYSLLKKLRVIAAIAIHY